MTRLRRGLSRRSTPAAARPLAGGQVAADAPVTAIGDAEDRQPVRLEGTLHSVTLRPRGGVPALEAELRDGTGSIVVVWLGRRRITGIDAGCSLRVQGRIGLHNGDRILYNPRYELLP